MRAWLPEGGWGQGAGRLGFRPRSEPCRAALDRHARRGRKGRRGAPKQRARGRSRSAPALRGEAHSIAPDLFFPLPSPPRIARPSIRPDSHPGRCRGSRKGKTRQNKPRQDKKKERRRKKRKRSGRLAIGAHEARRANRGRASARRLAAWPGLPGRPIPAGPAFLATKKEIFRLEPFFDTARRPCAENGRKTRTGGGR